MIYLGLRIIPKPGHLALGVVAISLLHSGDSGFERGASFEIFDNFNVSNTAESGIRFCVALSQKFLDFFYESKIEHLGNSSIDSVIEFCTISIVGRNKSRVIPESFLLSEGFFGLSGNLLDFECADDVGIAVWMDFCGIIGIYGMQLLPERFVAVFEPK